MTDDRSPATGDKYVMDYVTMRERYFTPQGNQTMTNRLFVVSSNMPEYLPTDDNPFIGHAVTGPDATEDDALMLVNVLADRIDRDGTASAEQFDDDDETASGDLGMVELWQTGHEAHRDAVRDVLAGLRADDASICTYVIHWHDGSTTAYSVQRCAEDVATCGDDICADCHTPERN